MDHRYKKSPEHAYKLMKEEFDDANDLLFDDQMAEPTADSLASEMISSIQNGVTEVLKAAADEMDEPGFNEFRKGFFADLKGALASEVATSSDLSHRHLTSRTKGQF